MGPQEQEIIRRLETPVADALRKNSAEISLKIFGTRKGVEDETLKLVVGVPENPTLAFALCSPAISPDMVSRSTKAASRAIEILGDDLGSAVLDPLLKGEIMGLSFALYPWLRSLSQKRPLWYFQRHFIRAPVLDWLQKVTRVSRRAAVSEDMLTSFLDPLNSIIEETGLPSHMRDTAEDAVRDLNSGRWKPMHILMHGDLWSGNVLIDPESGAKRWRDKFVIIDWAGSTELGFAIYDLVRFSESFRLPKSVLLKELKAHCGLLGCDLSHAKYYLLCALGHIRLNLEHFPKQRYLRMSRECFSQVSGVM